MKRKIEAKMREQSSSTHTTLAQEIAISILDKNEESPATTPSVQSPEGLRDSWASTIDNPSSNMPVPDPDPIEVKAAVNFMLNEDTHTPAIHPQEDQQTVAVLDNSPSIDTAPIPEPISDTPMTEDEEEARLLAELEAERLAEEKARQKRRELEDRLANTRGKKMQQLTNAIPEKERDGFHGNVTIPMQDSTSRLFQ
jgi:hypothetical protein